MHCVYHHGAKAITAVDEGRSDCGEVISVMRGEGATDILERDDTRRAAFTIQRGHEPPEGPERPRSFPFEPGAGTCERKVLAGERSPSQVNVTRQFSGG
jgi:hypothetical protein